MTKTAEERATLRYRASLAHEPHKDGTYRIFADGCYVCEARVGLGLDGLVYLDATNLRRLGGLVYELYVAGQADDVSDLDCRAAAILRDAAGFVFRSEVAEEVCR